MAATNRTVGEWLVQQVTSEKPDLVAVATLKHAMNHPRLPHVMLEGRYEGAWKRCRRGGARTMLSRDALQLAESSGGVECGRLLRQECGMAPFMPAAGLAGWWFLGKGFGEAARYFLWMTQRNPQFEFRLPVEIALLVLEHAAGLATVVQPAWHASPSSGMHA